MSGTLREDDDKDEEIVIVEDVNQLSDADDNDDDDAADERVASSNDDERDAIRRLADDQNPVLVKNRVSLPVEIPRAQQMIFRCGRAPRAERRAAAPDQRAVHQHVGNVLRAVVIQNAVVIRPHFRVRVGTAARDAKNFHLQIRRDVRRHVPVFERHKKFQRELQPAIRRDLV